MCRHTYIHIHTTHEKTYLQSIILGLYLCIYMLLFLYIRTLCAYEDTHTYIHTQRKKKRTFLSLYICIYILYIYVYYMHMQTHIHTYTHNARKNVLSVHHPRLACMYIHAFVFIIRILYAYADTHTYTHNARNNVP
jgi:hypothetical protein